MMAFLSASLAFIFILNAGIVLTQDDAPPESVHEYKFNTVMISILVRNKAHTLPYFLNYLEKLDYPKDRITLSIISDHNVDRSIEVLETWLAENKKHYHSVMSFLDKDSPPIDGEEGVAHWPLQRYTHHIYLRELALSSARHIWADYLWILDADVFIINPSTLKQLIAKRYPVAAPMLKSDGLYSNFWCGMTEDFYYKRTEDYYPILTRKKKGCHRVPMVHSAVLVDFRLVGSDNLTYDPLKLPGYKGPHDDIITFAQSSNSAGLGMYVCNDDVYGFVMVPLEKDDQLSFDLLQLRNLKLEALVENGALEASPLLEQFVREPAAEVIPVDKAYMINLERRPDRRKRMLQSLAELQLSVQVVNGIDGQFLTDSDLEALGVRLMPGYKDPYHKRPMKKGEIGCFLSHYNIWEEVARENYSIALVLEDDVRFEPFFNQKLSSIVQELKGLSFQWDLVYLGRKRLEDTEEPVEGSKLLVWPGYSYWTLGYLLSPAGARKLTAQRPLASILPVDEYLPILYDKHPEEEWKEFFPSRDLRALSAEPLALYPAWYLSEEGYSSDTEDSPTVTSHRPEL